MKLKKLTMSAFGSYASLQVIDFEKVDKGLFLISGDTGSGKTTIFDAIMFALYDRSSGGKRTGSMLRSRFAEASVKTYVELEFENHSSVYRIVRSPEYQRPSLRKNADGTRNLTIEPAQVELYYPDGTALMGRKKEIDEKIREIIGLDASQFNQIIMIAQGDFLKLLHARSEERKEIFSRIFDTHFYSSVQNRISEDCKQELMQYQNLKQEKIRLINEYSSDNEKWEEVKKASETSSSSVIEFMENQNKEDQKELEEKYDKLTQFDKTKMQLTADLTLAKKTNELFEQYYAECENFKKIVAQEQKIQKNELAVKDGEKALQIYKLEENYSLNCQNCKTAETEYELALKELKKLEEESKTWNTKKESFFKEYNVKSEKYQKEIIALEAMIESFKLLEKANKQYGEKEKIKSNLEAVQQNIKNEKESLNKQFNQYQQNVEKNNQIIARKSDLLKEYEEKNKILVNFDELQKMIEMHAQTLNKFEMQLAKQEKAKQEMLKAYHQAESYQQMFLAEQAGLLAYQLKENEPCPVCGSCHHPSLAILSNGAPSKEDVQSALKKKEQLENDLEEEKTKSIQLQMNVTEQKAKVEKWKELLELKEDDDIDFCQKQIQETLETIQNDLAKVTSAEKENDLNSQKIEEGQARLEQLENSVNENNQNLQKVDVELAVINKEISLLKDKLSFESKEEATNQLNQFNQANNLLKQEKEILEKKLTDINNQTSKIKGELERRNQEKENLKKLKEEAEKSYTALLNQLFSSEENYREAFISDDKLEILKEEISRFYNDKEVSYRLCESFKKQLDGKNKVEIEPIEYQLKQVQEESALMSKHIQQVQLRLKVNQSLTEAYIKIDKQIEKKEKSLFMMEKINRLLNGKINGKARLDLETYIQRYYFKRIVHEANQRLQQLNNGQFLLMCRDLKDLQGRGQVGLDLDVYNVINNSVMDVKTLSGGESFMAALAMALGLQSVVSSSVGAVEMKTMFIDEGFGSLDEEARNKAVELLSQLADNRLIGVVSHVSELKEQIPCQLVVHKGTNGSKARWNVDSL